LFAFRRNLADRRKTHLRHSSASLPHDGKVNPIYGIHTRLGTAHSLLIDEFDGGRQRLKVTRFPVTSSTLSFSRGFPPPPLQCPGAFHLRHVHHMHRHVARKIPTPFFLHRRCVSPDVHIRDAEEGTGAVNAGRHGRTVNQRTDEFFGRTFSPPGTQNWEPPAHSPVAMATGGDDDLVVT
jgi:hypothetical protein